MFKRIDISRANAVVTVLAVVAAIMVLIDTSLTLVVGSMGSKLPHGESPSDLTVVTKAGERLSGLIREREKSFSKPGPSLGVFLGQSTLQCGVDSQLLEQIDGLDYRWLNLYGNGGTIFRIADLAELLELSRLEPSVVVFAINPYMLAGTPYPKVRSAEGSLSRNRLKPWIWCWENRPVANHLFRRALLRARLRMFRSLGLGIEDLFPAAANPWKADPPVQTPEQTAMTDAELQFRLAYDRMIGWLDPANYTSASTNLHELERLIAQFQRKGCRVAVVLLPDRSIIRAELPAAAKALFQNIDPRVPVIDLGDALDDKLFLDLDHLAPAGRNACTQIIAQRLHNWLLADAPLATKETRAR